MSTQGTIKRYVLEVEKIASYGFPTFQDLKNFLSDHDFDISPRTLQRDIEHIRDEFGIEIKYNRSQNGYYIDEEASINHDAFLRFLEIAGTANLITESLRDSRETLNYISFESQGNLKGIENLKSFLFAVKNHRKVSFNHHNFETGKTRNYVIKPYLLKEYQNRWYLVGLLGGLNEFRTFGIDRMENIEVLTETFEPNLKLNAAQLFENVVGLTYSYGKEEEIILSFTPLQGKYVNALPLHKSQQIIHANADEVLISLNIIPNYELVQRILMFGDTVKVVKPDKLRKDIKDTIQKSLKNYQSKTNNIKDKG